MADVKPVRTESRTCFGLEWFEQEADAENRGAEVRDAGQTVNGGYMHGMECGRHSTAKAFDYTDAETGKRLYAVMVA